MTEFHYIACMAIPVAMQSRANALAYLMGWQPFDGLSFHFPLTSDGSAVTHFGLCTQMRQEAVTAIQNSSAVLDRIPWDSVPLTRSDAEAVLSALLIDIRDNYAKRGQSDIFREFLEANGLASLQREE